MAQNILIDPVILIVFDLLIIWQWLFRITKMYMYIV